MNLHLRVFAVLAMSGSLGTAACYQISGLDSFNDDGDGGTDASVVDASHAPDATPDAAGDTGTTATPQCTAVGEPCPSGTRCDLDSGACVEEPTCTPPSGGGCSTYPQCNCPANNTCTTNSSKNATECLQAGTLARNQPCGSAAPGQCEPGLGCFDNTCLAFCDPADVSTACERGQTCAAVSAQLGVYVCLQSCSPLANMCPSAENCDLPSDINNVPICVPGDGKLTTGNECNNGSGPSSRCAFSLICGPNGLCDLPVALDGGCEVDAGADAAPTPIPGAGFSYCLH